MSTNFTGDHVPSSPQPPLPHHPRDPLSACSCTLETEDGLAGPILVLHAAGEIDMLTIPMVRTALTTALEHLPRDLVVDLAGVDFCCMHGLSLLVETEHTARAAGIGFALSGLNTRLDRIATLLWPDEHLVRYRSAAAAVTAARVDRTDRLP